jgi:hypothetical protein
MNSTIDIRSTLSKMVGVVGEKGGDAFPILDRIWDVYASKGIRTVFLSVGSSKVALADLEIAESLGCPINVVPLNGSEVNSWNEVSGILKERKRETTASPFSIGAETKWILPKNLRIYDAVPWWHTGAMDLSGGSVSLKTQKFSDFLQGIATTMKIKDNSVRVDILKIDTVASSPGLERPILYSMLDAGFRPSLVLVRWSQMPDYDLSTTLAAGHLQNCGYSLIGKIDDKFLYYFTDEDIYQICSWEGITSNNPITMEIIKAAKYPRTTSAVEVPSTSS